jgi:hypothetical protein
VVYNEMYLALDEFWDDKLTMSISSRNLILLMVAQGKVPESRWAAVRLYGRRPGAWLDRDRPATRTVTGGHTGTVTVPVTQQGSPAGPGNRTRTQPGSDSGTRPGPGRSFNGQPSRTWAAVSVTAAGQLAGRSVVAVGPT